MTRITSHILDTTRGLPAPGVSVILYKLQDDAWTETGRSVTNADGRIAGFSGSSIASDPQVFKIKFDTREYFNRSGTASFYPYVEIVFETGDQDHYHIPLLLNPFGYTTYRGS